MNMRTFVLGPYQTNGFLLSEGGEAVFVDPGDNPMEAIEILEREGLKLTHILITHMHIDHFYGAAKLAAVTGAQVLGSAADDHMVESEIRDGGQWGYPVMEHEFTYTPVEEGGLELLGRPCQVVPTPGHTPGGLTFHFTEEGIAFVGDLIFLRNIGRTDFGGNYEDLIGSVKTRIFTMPDETVLYPGHGPETTVAGEKAHNPYFRS